MEKRHLQPAPALLLSIVLLVMLCNCSAYEPIEEIFVSCGSADNSSTGGRLWISDDNPIHYLLDRQKSLNFTANTQPSDINQVPYKTARLSRSEFSYSFPVTRGPKFVRLHFHPSDYDRNFPRSHAIFSVTSGHLVLLRNFSASLVADNLSSPSFSREFHVVVDDNQRLNLTFTSSPNSPNAYALINGIEIVSMPPDLYYSNGTDGFSDVNFLDNNGNPLILNYPYALETVHRINVGGRSIDPDEDTGMFRSWIGPDDPYLTEDQYSVTPANWTIHLAFDKERNYTAPENVYKTARSMGIDRKITTTYNLTWSFQVDSNFKYVVRLHFCEFQREINTRGQRVFKIFIDSKVADPQADVIRWTGDRGRGIPTHRDYAVDILAPVSKKINLSVALHPAPERDSVYADALLNGVEVFKISNDEGSLAGPNPDQTRNKDPVQPLPQPSPESQGIRKKLIVAISGSSVSGILMLILMCFLFYRQQTSSKKSICTDKTSQGPLSYTTTKSTESRNSSLPAYLCRRFSLAEIKSATDGFNEIFIVGVGGFGSVYKGYVDGGSTPVAIKRMTPGSQQGAREFMTEIEMLSQLRHHHLVSLIGYCNEEGEMILVYDYMSHGTLQDHLYNTENTILPWNQRLEVCIGAARGLHYLHAGMNNMIIHRDVKTTNILLDEKWVAKVSDFGLSKIGPANMPNSKDHVTTVVKGTFGYLDPEYYLRRQLTEKSDVYSFGIVLLEVLCARRPVNPMLEKEQISLASWAESCYRNGNLDKIVDPNMRGQIAPECLKKFGEIAMSCLQDEGALRPSMNDVVWGLEFAMQLQESAQEGMKTDVTFVGSSCEDETPPKWPSSGDDAGMPTGSSGMRSIEMTTTTIPSTSADSESIVASGAVFSEIKIPQGR